VEKDREKREKSSFEETEITRGEETETGDVWTSWAEKVGIRNHGGSRQAQRWTQPSP